MDPIQKLSQLFTEFPGIGSRQSKRFVYFLLHQPRSYTNELIEQIKEIQRGVAECSSCHRYYAIGTQSEANLCRTCKDSERDTQVLLVVEKDGDLESFERSHAYRGQYFVLGGTLQILEKDPQHFIRVKELLARIAQLQNKGLKEVIIATSITPESEHTGDFVRDAILEYSSSRGTEVKISFLGRGLSSGSELEYADPDTLRHALEGRK